MTPLDHLTAIGRVLDSLDVRWVLGGSLASSMVGEPRSTVWIGSAPDQVLRKLRWFQLGGEASERQWRDVLAILRVQGTRIDLDRLLLDAELLGLGELAERAVAELRTGGLSS